jgi:hypothetical protein
MYCVNASSLTDFKKAKWGGTGYNNEVVPPPTWISDAGVGGKGHNNLILLYGPENKTPLTYLNRTWYFDHDPAALCAKFVKLCTDEFGPQFHFVGAGSIGWHGLSVFNANERNSQNPKPYMCPERSSNSIDQSKTHLRKEGPFYDVTCLAPNPNHATHFWLLRNRVKQENGRVWLYWTNKVKTYTAETEVVQGKLKFDFTIDQVNADVGKKYCSGKPSDE